MPNPRRIKRLQQLILEVAAETVQREVKDPRMGLATITRVKLSPDLTQAVVYWSCLEEEGKRRRTGDAIESARPLLQRRVAEALHTRVTPHLELRFDPSLEHAQRLETIFVKLAEERGETDEEVPEEADDEVAAGADDAGDGSSEPMDERPPVG